MHVSRTGELSKHDPLKHPLGTESSRSQGHVKFQLQAPMTTIYPYGAYEAM